jgi:hypothetical protein
MPYRFVAWIGALVLFSVSVSLPVAGQSKPAPKVWKVPRTPDGQPDLQGVWTTSTVTPLERPAEFAGKEFLTEKEAAEYANRVVAERNSDQGFNYNEFWRDRGTKVIASRRSSLIVDPPDGKIPPLTPQAQKRQADAREYADRHPADGPESRSVQERCLGRGLPIIPMNYNNNYQIVQAPGYVVIVHEMNHDPRIVPLDGRPHIPKNIRNWMGDRRGHWEGDTLVIESTNFYDKANLRGASGGLQLVERFTRVDADTINYEFTVNDPATYTRPWSAQMPMTRSEGLMYEYACHEGNRAMSLILSGARAEEKKAAEEQRRK